MRRIVVVLAGLLALVVVVGSAFWVGTAVGDGDDDDARGPMMSGTEDPDDDLGMMSGSGRSGRGDRAGSGTGGVGMGSGLMDVDSEAEYLVAMIPHHEEAIGAAEELARSDRPEMRDLGAAVVAGQSAQVEQMQGWLDRWHPGAEADTDYEPMMRDLSGLSGDELDRAFLVDMIGHHMVAVMMSQRLRMHGDVEHPQVARLAEDISAQQREEMVQMRTWLVDWFSA
ncbi:DUF305 domain-containing protein [Nocardioides sp. HDW12B]|uniref:DUF305 domain-containing protein n=1 Tax=Nocardioides sp. HDW12B TaxID=2714939 RepID=UPI00140C40A0|nr:DUF305 domain-containing protein [Nocardioides sp. HDW12B]QIK65048.1 DUF305 domain-containing protein [Nocardioides sp. HDW12B]